MSISELARQSIQDEFDYKDSIDTAKLIKENPSLSKNWATFLPQVWEELPEFESFFGHLLSKANLLMNSFKNHPTIYTYQVNKYKH